jgi:hypothetical protein
VPELLRLGQMEAAEERPVVHCERLLEVVPGKRRLELPEITRQSVGIQPEVVTGAEHRVVTQGRAKDVK